MKDKFLKLAKVKTEEEFYRRYPDKESFFKAHGKELKKAGLGDILEKAAPFADVPGKLVQGFQQLKDEKTKRKKAEQWANVSDVVVQASQLQPDIPERRYVRPEDVINTGEEYFPIYGVGTNVLKNGGEIMNTYAPHTLYKDLEYSKKAVNGEWLKGTKFGNIATEYGDEASNLVTAIGGENAGGNIGGTIGETAGQILGGPIGGIVGKIGGQVIGGLIDRNPAKLKRANEHIQGNVDKLGMVRGVGGVQQQYSSFMRTGGNIRNNELSELDDYAFGGDLKVYDGDVEPLSYNPYLGSETVMFKGPSHENGGIPISYGRNPVEVEGGEPALKMKDGGNQDNLVIFGNLQIPKGMLKDPDSKGKKFKSYIADLSKKEAKANKVMDSSTKLLNETQDNTSIDKLKLSSLKANLLGSDMKLKDIAAKKEEAAFLQNAINDTADELGLIADSLAKGKVEKAKYGKKIAAEGDKEPLTYYPSAYEIDPEEDIKVEDWMLKDKLFIGKDKKKIDWEKVFDKGLAATKSMLPYLRPSDAESLDPKQLAGEMYAMSNNQLEPVYAQTFQPELTTPQTFSLQDILNENTADYRATEKMLANNPAALAILNAQKYGANQKVLGEQFRMNQVEKARVYEKNRDVVNQAKIANMNILAQQQEKQTQAKANTKAIAQKAIESMANKYLQNKLENRTLQTYENLYNYRFDDRGRAINMNAPYEFNVEGYGKGSAKEALPTGYEYIYNKLGQPIDIRKSTKEDKRNGGLVKSLKNY